MRYIASVSPSDTSGFQFLMIQDREEELREIPTK